MKNTFQQEYKLSKSFLSYEEWLEQELLSLRIKKAIQELQESIKPNFYKHKKVYEPGTDHPNGVDYETQEEYFGR